MKIKVIILGCGSSMGVPRSDGFFGNCDPKNKRNFRTRCSAIIKTTNKNILIDTSPDLRHQLLRHKIKKIDHHDEDNINFQKLYKFSNKKYRYIKSSKNVRVQTVNSSKLMKRSP